MKTDLRIDAIAAELLDAYDRNVSVQPITTRQPDFDIPTAYRVSAEVHRWRLARGERPVGRKIGFTNRTIWPEYGVYTPNWSHVYDTTTTFLDSSAGTLALDRFAEPRIEPEIVLHFKNAPPSTQDEAVLLSCVDWIAHGFEIVQSHFPGWKFQAADTTAASALHGALVVGPPRSIDDLDNLVAKLRSFTITLARDGVVLSQGGGANVLDSPLLAAAHLLSLLKHQPFFAPVQAGEIVTTGTLTAALPVRAGETWSTQFSGLELDGLRLELR